MNAEEREQAALCMWLLGFSASQIVRAFYIAGMPLPDPRRFSNAHTTTER